MNCPKCGSDKLKFKAWKKNKRRQYHCKNCNSYVVIDAIDEEKELQKEDGIRTEERDGNKVVEYKGKVPKSPDQLLKDAGIDLEKWIIDKPTIKSWTVTLKIDGKIEQVVNYYVAVPLRPKYPIKQDLPQIQPLQITVKPSKAKVNGTKVDYCLFFGDSHIGFLKDLATNELTPFHHREALSQILNLASDLQPSHIVILGDMLDLPEWSDKYLVRPEFYFTTQPALIELGWILGKLRASCPNAKIDFMKGNHTIRIDKMVIRHLLPLYNVASVDQLNNPPVTSVEFLLDFKGLDIKFYGYPKESAWVNNIEFVHGTIARQGNTAYEMLKDSCNSKVFGHIHRKEIQYKTINDCGNRREIWAASAGCTCWTDGRVPSNSARDNWQIGAGLIDLNNPYPRLIPLGKLIQIDGKEFEGWDYLEELGDETHYKF